MTRVFVDDEQAAEDWMYEHTNAGYASHHIMLNNGDVEALRSGKIMVIGGEYGVEISWWEGEDDEDTI